MVDRLNIPEEEKAAAVLEQARVELGIFVDSLYKPNVNPKDAAIRRGTVDYYAEQFKDNSMFAIVAEPYVSGYPFLTATVNHLFRLGVTTKDDLIDFNPYEAYLDVPNFGDKKFTLVTLMRNVALAERDLG